MSAMAARTAPEASPCRSHPDRLRQFESEALPHHRDLLALARSLAHGHSEAEDLVQEAYLTAWQRFDTYQSGTNCRAWLSKILVHKAQHHYRRTSRWRPLEGDPDHAVMTHPAVFEKVSGDQVLGSLDELPRDLSQVVRLADVQGFKYREIADRLEIPLGTVMSRLHRGRRRLRKQLQPYATRYHPAALRPAA